VALDDNPSDLYEFLLKKEAIELKHVDFHLQLFYFGLYVVRFLIFFFLSG